MSSPSGGKWCLIGRTKFLALTFTFTSHPICKTQETFFALSTEVCIDSRSYQSNSYLTLTQVDHLRRAETCYYQSPPYVAKYAALQSPCPPGTARSCQWKSHPRWCRFTSRGLSAQLLDQHHRHQAFFKCFCIFISASFSQSMEPSSSRLCPTME